MSEFEDDPVDPMWGEDDGIFEEALLGGELEGAFFSTEQTEEDSTASGSSGPGKKTAREPLAKCHKCKRTYYAFDGFKNHMKSHLFEEVYRECQPLENTFLEHCRKESKAILDNSSKLTGNAGLTKEVIVIASSLLASDYATNTFSDTIAQEIWKCVPQPSALGLSKFHSTFVTSTHHLQANPDKRSVFKKCLSDIMMPEQCSERALEWFIGQFPLKLIREAEAFILKCMQEPNEVLLSTVSRDDINNPKFQQSVYYVGGSMIKSILRQAFRSSNETTWNNIVTCITDRFLAGHFASSPASAVTEWAEAVDRGGLQHISEKLWVFLMALSTILVKVELDTGSVKHETVLTEVMADPILMLWDECVDNSLCAADSDFLLGKVCYFFGNTWGSGMTKRLMNEGVDTRDKVAFRASLLPRKN